MKKAATKRKKTAKKKEKLKPQHEMFCIHMTRPGAPTFNNATLSYACVYQPEIFRLSRDIPEGKKRSPYEVSYDSCNASGSKLLAKDSIRARIQQRMLKLFNDNDALDSRLAHLAFQSDDLHVSLAATRDVNKLKRRISDEPAVPPGAAPITKIEIVMPKQ